MPFVFAAIVAGGAAYLGYRYLARERKRQQQARAAREAASRQAGGQARGQVGPNDRGNLEWDEQSGSYRPRD